jgi:hypothetical protein
MTEAEWLACTDPQPMLEFLRDKASDRKLRLLALECWRRIDRHGADEEWHREALRVYEWMAEGEGTNEDLASIGVNPVDVQPAEQDAAVASRAAAESKGAVARQFELVAQCQILHDLIGNPFRPLHIAPTWLSWRDGTVPQLAQGIYNDRAFDRLPILADALEDDGCTDLDILAHCRQPGEHVRGCWVVDLLLGEQ